MQTMQEETYKKRINLDLWKEIIKYSLPYKKILLGLAVVMLLVAGVDAVLPLMTRYAIDNFVVPNQLEGFRSFALVYFLIISLQALNIFLFIYLAGRLETDIACDIRQAAFEKLQLLSLSYYDKRPVGWLMARLTSDIHRLSSVISWGVVDLVWGGSMMVTIMGIMLILNFRLAVITLSVVPPLVLISLYFQKKILGEFRLVRKLNSRITGAFNEGISGARTSKTLVREEDNSREFAELTASMKASSVRAAVFSALFMPLVLSLSSMGTGLALWRGGSAVFQGFITYGTLVAFVNYTIQFFEPVRELARVFAELQSAQAAGERVLSLINTEPEITDTEEVTARFGTIIQPDRTNWPDFKGQVQFRGVGFYYQPEEPILDNFNLVVNPGEKIALVGETGSGKSTIVNLLCRFYEPVSGQILLDGIDYRRRSQSWLQSHIGYVLQDPHLFSGTIADNIRFARPLASEADIKKAARLVQADSFIDRLPQGYQTEVGEGGDLLSTGQKQLISFARAILNDPVLFVLDEATSSIDTEMEIIIQKAVDQVLAGRTSFIIAHRLSTIKHADRILVLSGGKIRESGSHLELLERRGYYYELYQNQFVGRNLEESLKFKVGS